MKVCFKKEEKFMLILVVNAGSSSLKYQVRDTSAPESEQMITSGLIENIGTDVPDHEVALHMMAEKLEGVLHGRQLQAIGHRVVQGAEKFTHPVLLNEQVIDEIDALSPLAPLHNPAHVKGMRAAFHTWPDLPQVAVFDTAFHSTMPEHAWRYAIPYDLADKYSIRRYGFHGTSHEYVSHVAADMLGIARDEFNGVVAHLGNGASVTAVKGGKSVDTSMGYTPLAGLVMGTRSGDIDPSALTTILTRDPEIDAERLDTILNKESGLLALAATIRTKGTTGNVASYLDDDIAFHRLIMEASHNDTFKALTEVVAEVLSGRARLTGQVQVPQPEALKLHERVASAIATGDATAAESSMRDLVAEVRGALLERGLRGFLEA